MAKRHPETQIIVGIWILSPSLQLLPALPTPAESTGDEREFVVNQNTRLNELFPASELHQQVHREIAWLCLGIRLFLFAEDL